MVQGTRNTTLGASGVCALGALLVLIVFQGGYSQLASNAVGIFLGVVALVCAVRAKRESLQIPLAACCLCLLAALYVISALINGATLTTLTSAGTWCALAAFSLIVGIKGGQWRAQMLNAVTWMSLGITVLALLGWALDLSGLVDGNRLQFTFQYANVAALWFAVTVLLCAYGMRVQKNLITLPLLALILTQSFGVLLAFTLVVVALVVIHGLQARRGIAQMDTPFAREWVTQFVVQLVAAVVFFVLLWVAAGVVRVVLCALMITVVIAAAVGVQGHGLDGVIGTLPVKTQRLIIMVAVVCAVVAVLVILILGSDRVAEGGRHLMERFVQIHDALVLWLGAPLFGLGPDNWAYLYPYAQTAQYISATVHSTYMKVLVDSGIFGLAAFVAAAVFGVRALQGAGQECQLACVAVMLLHFLIDFDGRFVAAMMLLALLICVPVQGGAVQVKGMTQIKGTTPVKGAGADKTEHAAVHHEHGGKPGVLAAAALGLLLCFVGTSSALTTSGASAWALMGDATSLAGLVDNNALARADVSIQNKLVETLHDQGEYAALVAFYDAYGVSSDVQAVYEAHGLYQEERWDEARQVLVTILEQQPGNYDLFVAANTYLVEWGLSGELQTRYTAAVDAANALASTPVAQMLDTQKTVQHY